MDQEVREAELKQATADTLAAENAKLRAELDAMKQAQHASVTSAPVVAEEIVGMTIPKHMTVIEVKHQDFKHEKIASTTRRDMGFDASQRFNGRQP